MTWSQYVPNISPATTSASLLLDPEYGMLYRQNSDMILAFDSLGANWSRICLSRTLNHGALWHIDSLRLRNILTYLLTYLHLACENIHNIQVSDASADTTLLWTTNPNSQGKQSTWN